MTVRAAGREGGVDGGGEGGGDEASGGGEGGGGEGDDREGGDSEAVGSEAAARLGGVGGEVWCWGEIGFPCRRRSRHRGHVARRAAVA